MILLRGFSLGGEVVPQWFYYEAFDIAFSCLLMVDVDLENIPLLLECHRIHLVHRPKVLLSGAVCTPSTNEAASYGINDLSVAPSFDVPRRIISSRLAVSVVYGSWG